MPPGCAGGTNWNMVSSDSLVNARPFYFSQVTVDPKDPNRVYAMSFQMMMSTDGGKNFTAIANQVHGAMGFTYEHTLHHSTRRLWGWREEFGNETLWAERLGRMVAAAGADELWPFVTRGS